MDNLMLTDKENRIFKAISNKEENFVRIPRKAFIDELTLEGNLEAFTFDKTVIESWNYQQIIADIFYSKKDRTDDVDLKNALCLMQKDLCHLLFECFQVSELCRPHEISLRIIQGVPCTKLHADFLPLRMLCTYKGPGTIFLLKSLVTKKDLS